MTLAAVVPAIIPAEAGIRAGRVWIPATQIRWHELCENDVGNVLVMKYP